MSLARRRFLRLAGGALGFAACRPGPAEQTTAPTASGGSPPPADPPLRPEPILLGGQAQKILILGGTAFLGPQLVEAAQRRGHTVTLFNRGKTRPELFPNVEKLRGDRDGDLKALEGRTWDTVIDTSGYVPRIVKASAELLAPKVRQYVFVSTISVYADTSKIGIDEDAPLATTPDPTTEDIMPNYGALKALCEQAAEAAMPKRTTVVRPGLIVGPGDGSDRFTYWPVRVAAGGEVLAPGDPSTPVQFIDVRDLAEFIITAIEGGHVGIYNATGAPLPMGDLLNGSKAALASNAEFTWVDRQFLADNKVEPWSDLPVWIPPDPGFEGAATFRIDRATAIGLKFRPLAETVTETVAWWNTLPEARRAKPRAGITRARETELLAAWHAAHPAPGKGKPAKKKKAA
ncbi:NAD-dependent epimerase/dehydratase family protein [Nannocystis sp. SCPEA4]|uniref:NAD-dependent epimerase/dehydratase family protein n=1 Tax=Nannocystis sp. SCPEA4 TaxID=2996787 RepID=UPI00226DB2BF|nr:NAD-dependent epimerase/dehydratase family protein [Nannocystis sp. SCPEA4]MCY1054235.1 NAD-dependent epimerase/dehydratase family protein [Nannocystis sp. SCPEA4]